MRWMGWLGKLVVGAVFVSFLSVFTTVYLVDQYITAILQRLNMADVERPVLKLDELLMGGAKPSAATGTREERIPGDKQGDPEQPPEGALKVNASPTMDPDAIAEQEPSVPVFEHNLHEDALVMSAEEFNIKRKKLTEEDRLEIFTIMMKSLPQEELQKMSALLEDGITEEEVKNMEEVIHAYLHQDDVARLLSILNKY